MKLPDCVAIRSTMPNAAASSAATVPRLPSALKTSVRRLQKRWRRRTAQGKRREIELVVREEGIHLTACTAERAGEAGAEGGEREHVRPVAQPWRQRPRV